VAAASQIPHQDRRKPQSPRWASSALFISEAGVTVKIICLAITALKIIKTLSCHLDLAGQCPPPRCRKRHCISCSSLTLLNAPAVLFTSPSAVCSGAGTELLVYSINFYGKINCLRRQKTRADESETKAVTAEQIMTNCSLFYTNLRSP